MVDQGLLKRMSGRTGSTNKGRRTRLDDTDATQISGGWENVKQNERRWKRGGQRTQYPATASDPNVPSGQEKDGALDRAAEAQGLCRGPTI
jgi:hypothetical protein